MNTAHRLALVEPGELDDEQRALYEAVTGGLRSRLSTPPVDERGRLRAPFNAMLYAPGLGVITQALGEELRFSGTLEPRMRELVICSVAAGTRCRHEWDVHSAIAAELDVTPLQLEAVRTGRAVPDLSRAETTALRLVRDLLRRRAISDRHYTRASEELGQQKVVEIAILVGYYAMLAGLLNVALSPDPTWST